MRPWIVDRNLQDISCILTRFLHGWPYCNDLWHTRSSSTSLQKADTLQRNSQSNSPVQKDSDKYRAGTFCKRWSSRHPSAYQTFQLGNPDKSLYPLSADMFLCRKSHMICFLYIFDIYQERISCMQFCFLHQPTFHMYQPDMPSIVESLCEAGRTLYGTGNMAIFLFDDCTSPYHTVAQRWWLLGQPKSIRSCEWASWQSN